MSPFLSIIVPCYNSESYMARCIESILNQTAGDFELILIDDGSTDKTADLCKTYSSDERVKVLTQENQGPAEARNLGVKHASGKYVWFIDSDDYIVEGAVFRITEILTETDVDILRFHYKHLFNGIDSAETPAVFPLGVHTDEALDIIRHYAVANITSSPFFLWMHVYKRELIKDVPMLSLRECLSESNSFNQRVYVRAESLQVTDDALYCYCVRPGSLIFTRRAVLDKALNTYRAIKEDFTALGIYGEYRDDCSLIFMDKYILGEGDVKNGAIMSEYLHSASLRIAHERVLNAISGGTFQELLAQAGERELTPEKETLYGLLRKKDEKSLYSRLMAQANE